RGPSVCDQLSPFHCFWSQVLLILTALQPAILSILASSGQIACAPPLSSKTRSQYMSVQLLILETFIITVVTRMYYRKQVTRRTPPLAFSLGWGHEKKT
ncbi:solute carrier family 51 alpha subunit, partial [Chelydra serpentina]